MDALNVSEILGHSSPAITQSVYQHVRIERLEAAIQAASDSTATEWAYNGHTTAPGARHGSRGPMRFRW